MRKNILVKARVSMALARLGTENSLQMCGEVNGIVKDMASIILRDFCVAIRKHLKPLVIPKLTRNKIKEIITGFECLHEIPCILGAMDGSHVPIYSTYGRSQIILLLEKFIFHTDSKSCRCKA
jgi:hypothetical protein